MLEMVLKHPEEVPALVKLKLASVQASRFVPPEPHWAFCYKLLKRVSRSFAIVIHQLGPELRNAVSNSLITSVLLLVFTPFPVRAKKVLVALPFAGIYTESAISSSLFLFLLGH
jgi:hypothetical protein